MMECETVTVTIKVGVTRTTLARHRGSVIESMRSSPTPLSKNDSVVWMKSLISGLLGEVFDKRIEGALVCVIPELEGSVCRAWKMSTGGDLRLFDPACAPFTLDYRPPGALGRDRSAAIWGALDRFGAALGKAFMVADFGTHTVTTVWHEGCVLGGSIAPGLALQRKSVGGGRVILVPGTEGKEGRKKLDRFHDKRGFGQSTSESIEAGVVLGSVAAIEGLRRRVERELGQPVSLVLTGGFACRLSPLFSQGVFRNRQLVHYGAWKFLSCS